MLSTPFTVLLDRLRTNAFDPEGVAFLEQTSAESLVSELRGLYPWTFQERRIGNKWEVGLARRFQVEMVAQRVGESGLLSFRLVPTYRQCLMVSIEMDRITGLSRFGKLKLRVTRKPTPGLLLRMSPGAKLDRLPDGWEIKELQKRTVQFDEAFLRGRGWQLDHLRHLAPNR